MASRSLKRLPALPADVVEEEVVSAGVVAVDVNGVGSGVVVDIPPADDEAPDVDIRFDLRVCFSIKDSTFGNVHVMSVGFESTG